MKIDKLILFKAIYPRHLDVGMDNKVEPDNENVEDIIDYIKLNGKLPAKIRYNKNHMKNCPCGHTDGYHVIDGTHTTLAAQREGWTEIPNGFLEALDLPIEEEIIYAVHYNVTHGLKLKRSEVKAVLHLKLLDIKGKLKYGTLPKLSKLWGVPLKTLERWCDELRHPERNVPVRVRSDDDERGTKEDIGELKREIEQKDIVIAQERREKEEYKTKWDMFVIDCLQKCTHRKDCPIGLGKTK